MARGRSIGPPTRFFGRDDDLARLAEAFATGTRLFTLLGPAGMGKTRLAQSFLARRAEPSARDAFCDLTDAKHKHDVTAAVARALSVSLIGERDDEEAVGAAIAARGACCIVLDDCEGAVADIADLVAGWLRRASEAMFLATSRARLDVHGERVLELDPLPLDSAAIELFVDRAKLAGHRRQPGDDRETIAEIVRRLDGIPLAIELAAARAGLLSPKEILARLGDRFAMLAAGPRDASTRQRTLRAAIDASWEPLTEDERRALSTCSVFRAGFDLEAAGAILALDEMQTLDVLQRLRDSSMLRVDTAGATTRFGFYESIRAYAADRLRERGEPAIEDARARHAAYFADAAPRWSAAWARQGDGAALERLAADVDNVAEAHTFSLARVERSAEHAEHALRLMNASASLFIARGPTETYHTALDRTLAPHVVARGSRGAVVAVLLRRAYLHAVLGRWSDARRDLDDALVAARAANDDPTEANALRILGTIERMAGNTAASRDALSAAVVVARRTHDEALLALVLLNLAQLDHLAGRLDAARAGLEEVRRLEATGSAHSSFGLLEHTLGSVLQELGQVDEARIEHEKAVAVARARDHRHYLGWFVLGLAQVMHETGALDDARARYEEAIEVVRALNDRVALALSLGGLAAVHASLGRASDANTVLVEADLVGTALAQSRLSLALSLFRGLVELATPDVVVDQVRARLFAARDDAATSDEVRFARRLLERALTTQSHRSSTSSDDAGALVVAEDGAWFELADGVRVELRDRPLLRRLLRALVQARIDAPNSALSIEALARSGWPDERILPAAAANRVHVSLTRLRKLGLARALLAVEHGHLLDPSVPLRLARA